MEQIKINGDLQIVPLTNEELAQIEKDKASMKKIEAEFEAKKLAKEEALNKLEKLGLTRNDLSLIFNQ